MSILFVNACVRQNSRTLVLAQDVLQRMEGEVIRVNLMEEDLHPLDQKTLEMRERLLQEGKMDDPMFRYARQFAEAEEIVIAAPFWDLSFPALLKVYLEQITVAGITFAYREGRPSGLCLANRLVYVTTSGGKILCDFGYAYVKTLAQTFYGIEQTKTVRVENLDVDMISAQDLLGLAEVVELS